MKTTFPFYIARSCRCRFASYLFVLLLLFLGVNRGNAQISYGAQSSALNHSVTALNNNNWAVFANPATVSEHQKSASFYYVRYYNMDELTDIAATISYPLKWGVLSGGVHAYGFELYREMEIYTSWMMRFQQLKTAVSLHYEHISFPSPYGSDGALGIDAGIFLPINEKIELGASATNINNPKIGIDAEERPQIMRLGLAYKPLSKGIVLVEAIKDIRYPIAGRIGLEYPLIDALTVRAGVGNQPVNTTFGAGIFIGNWNVNLSAERHQDLGWSPGIDVVFHW